MNLSEDDILPIQLVPRVRPEKPALSSPVRDAVFHDFMEESGDGPTELAIRHQVPLSEVLHWFRDGRWVELKREFTRVSRDVEELRYANLVAEDRAKVGREQMDLGKAAEEIVMNALEAMKEGAEVPVGKGRTMPVSPRDIKNIMEAATAATAIRARVVGLTEKVAADSQAQANVANPQLKAALLVIGARPIGPAPIDVTSEVKESK